jgi:eukaryotic-like serine/threonine-protein kinase
LTVGGAVVVFGGLALGGGFFFSHKTHALTDKDTIVLADFTNTTGDPVFDDTLKQALAVDLGQSPFPEYPLGRKSSADNARNDSLTQ